MAFDLAGAFQGGAQGAGAGASFGPWGALAGGLIGGAAGGFLGGGDGGKAARELWGRQADKQEFWMQNALRWRVEDARRAGIHPLAAIGSPIQSAQVPSISVGDSGGGVGGALADMGQNLSRAASAFMSNDAKYETTLRTLQVERGELENQILVEQLKQLRAPGSPPDFPDVLGPTNRPYPPNSPVSVVPLGPPPAAQASGVTEVDPSKVFTHDPGRPGMQAGYNPESRWQRNELGGIDRMPGEAWQMDDPGAPGYVTWQLRNSILPALPFGQRALPSPPRKYEQPGQTGWQYKVGIGYIPVFRKPHWSDAFDQSYVPLERR